MVQDNIGSVIVVVQSIDTQTPTGIITERDILAASGRLQQSRCYLP
jgi:predicted transcriptional regulator